MNDLAPTQRYGGQGHTQDIALTLAPGYSYGGWRFSVEGGPWIFWQTRHEDTRETTRMVDASFKTVAQLGHL
ncbi:hypothetical protein [Burkholderia pyrrocinia]|uniref:hypothetical protein n=1 Tax=Burkholderia pyrrocinia TaxID=60550 RepID=UPI001BCD14C3|nr:hypothetical protein [Burkholderia pyrrocinia]QVN19973.1 hypothetical protein JYG32_09635 [Burkholderia pyrrocinia]